MSARQVRRIGAPLGLVTTALFTNYLDTYLLLGIFPPGRYLATVLKNRIWPLGLVTYIATSSDESRDFYHGRYCDPPTDSTRIDPKREEATHAHLYHLLRPLKVRTQGHQFGGHRERNVWDRIGTNRGKQRGL